MAWVLTNVTKARDDTAACDAATVVGRHHAYGEISPLDFELDDELGTLVVDPDDQYTLTDSGTLVFGGLARVVEQTDDGLTTQRRYRITCQDYTKLLQDDVVDVPALRQTVESDAARIAWLFATFGTKGVTVGAEVQTLKNPIGIDQDFFGLDLHQCMTAIESLSGVNGRFYVGFDKKLHHFVNEAAGAPYGLSDTPVAGVSVEYENFKLPKDVVAFCNAVFVTNGTPDIAVWRYIGGVPPAAGARRAAVINDPEILTIAEAQARGDSYIAANGVVYQPGSVDTFQPGFLAGQNVNITNAGWALVAQPFRIQVIEFRPETKDRIRYSLNFGAPLPKLSDYVGSVQADTQVAIRAAAAVTQLATNMQAAGANLVPNSSFEDTTGWTLGALHSIAFDPVTPQEAWHGSKVLRVAPVGGAAALTNLTAFIPVDRTKEYWASWYTFMRARTVGGLRVRVSEYDAAQVFLVTTPIDVDAVETNWTRRSLHFGSDSANGKIAFQPTTAFVRVIVENLVTANFTADVDAVQIEQSRVLTDYSPSPYELVDNSVIVSKLSALVQSALADDASNMLVNGGGEQGADYQNPPPGWTFGAGQGAYVDPGTQKYGSRSIAINNVALDNSYVFQELPVEAGVMYICSGWVKVGAISPASLGAIINIDSISAGAVTVEEQWGGVGGGSPDIGLQAVVDWTFIFVRLKFASNGTARIHLQFGYLASRTGQAWFDGLRFARVSKVVADDIVAGSVTTAALDALAVTSAKIAANAIIAGKIAAGIITGVEIAAGTIVADKLSVGAASARSIVPNYSFEDVNLAGFPSVPLHWADAGSSGGANGFVFGELGGHEGAWNFVHYAGVTYQSSSISDRFPVAQNVRYYCSSWRVAVGGTTTTGAYFRIHWYDAANSLISDSDVVGGLGSTSVWTKGDGYVTAPTNAVWARVQLFNYLPNVATYLKWDEIVMLPMAGGLVNSTGEVVADGSGLAITNGKLTVTNPGSVVIIDGTSNIFKILATGTLSQAFGIVHTVATSFTVLTALGNGYSVPPTAMFSVTNDSAASGAVAGRAQSSYYEIDDVNSPYGVIKRHSQTFINLSSGYPQVNLSAWNDTVAGGATPPVAACRYHVMVEAAI